MNALNPTSSLTDTAVQTRFVPEIRSDATIEELDEWIIALGGREISPEEALEWRNKIHWSHIPGETAPI